MDTIYDQLVAERGLPELPRTIVPTKRDRHRGGQVTGQVWDIINGGEPAVVAGIKVHPVVSRV